MSLPVLAFPDYTIDESGKVWSMKTKKYLKPAYSKSGYASVELFNENGSKRMLIHRLVASAFIPNPNNYPQVNHKDENPANNSVDNLEWCTAKYNMNYGNGAKNRHLKIDYTKPCYRENAIKNGKKVSLPVVMLSNGVEINRFASAKEASKATGISHSNILRAVHKERATAGGYTWKRLEVSL